MYSLKGIPFFMLSSLLVEFPSLYYVVSRWNSFLYVMYSLCDIPFFMLGTLLIVFLVHAIINMCLVNDAVVHASLQTSASSALINSTDDIPPCHLLIPASTTSL